MNPLNFKILKPSKMALNKDCLHHILLKSAEKISTPPGCGVYNSYIIPVTLALYHRCKWLGRTELDHQYCWACVVQLRKIICIWKGHYLSERRDAIFRVLNSLFPHKATTKFILKFRFNTVRKHLSYCQNMVQLL